MQITKQNNLSDWWERKDSPLLIAGPCSAESEMQVLNTARQIAQSGKTSIFRAGVWKPRTRPGSFDGIGVTALPWLEKVKEETGLLVSTEVASTFHVEQALKHNIDVLWIGARTTVNPFLVQELSESLRGADIPVFIKNPIHEEIALWDGAIERFSQVGLNNIGAIHRGFFSSNSAPFRNIPSWSVAVELMRLYPDMPIITDPSHIAGRRDLIAKICQTSLDLNFDGFIIETHNNPDVALSDAAQQITPSNLDDIMNRLCFKPETTGDEKYLGHLSELRENLNDIDEQFLQILSTRVKAVKEIEDFKSKNNVSSFEIKRLNEILKTRVLKGAELGLSEALVEDIYNTLFKNTFQMQTDISENASTDPDNI
ncbi:MAG: chorismate mutase [Bacteroidota bacterium]